MTDLIERLRNFEGSDALGNGDFSLLHEAADALEAARGMVDGCHCATCTCNPGMTPAIRFDTSPAAQEGAVRDRLIALGWTPPGSQQPAVHPAITHCDNCGCDWLDNGLNPIGCPYCKQPASAVEHDFKEGA